MGLDKDRFYHVYYKVSIGYTLLILKYKYWLNGVNPHFPDATPWNNKYAKEFAFYNKNYNKLKLLINSNSNENLYKNLIE